MTTTTRARSRSRSDLSRQSRVGLIDLPTGLTRDPIDRPPGRDVLDTDREGKRYRRVALVYDGSPASRTALATAVDLAVNRRARVAILGLARPAMVAAYGLAQAGMASDLASPKLCAQLATDLRADLCAVTPDVSVTTEVRSGRPVREILRFAHGQPLDVLVLGVSARTFGFWPVTPVVCWQVTRRTELEVRAVRKGSAVTA